MILGNGSKNNIDRSLKGGKCLKRKNKEELRVRNHAHRSYTEDLRPLSLMDINKVDPGLTCLPFFVQDHTTLVQFQDA